MRLTVVVLGGALAGCGTDPGKPVIFPADYAATYTEVRNCRGSVEHGPINVRVMASPEAATTYSSRTGAFATGAILLKEEYAEADTACAGPIKSWTVMEKLDDGTSPDTIDWHWQKVGSGRHVMTENDSTCIACHTDCAPPTGYLHTCTAP